MRLHRLAVEAFGPFAGRVEVDFDELSEAGIFLVHGPTGSGKTSLLDAVCFALYGRLPGIRPGGGSLRSDHAEPDARPEVTVELTVGGRRLRVNRSPEHQRPKRRGAGLTPVRPFVQVDEHVGGQWITRATRVEEAGDLLGRALGMGLDQFVKVVVLPQGDFAAFLRATPEVRREVLERLFDVGRFTGVEEWLVARRGELRAASSQARHAADAQRVRLADVLTRLSPAAAAHVPGVADLSAIVAADGLDPRALAASGSEVGVPAAVGEALGVVRAGLAEHAAATLTERDLAERRLDLAEQTLRVATTTADRVTRGRRARRLIDETAERAETLTRSRTLLVDAERAARVAGDLRSLDLAAAEVERARDDLRGAFARVEALAPFSPVEVHGHLDPPEVLDPHGRFALLSPEPGADDGDDPAGLGASEAERPTGSALARWTALADAVTAADTDVAEIARLLPVLAAGRASRVATQARAAEARDGLLAAGAAQEQLALSRAKIRARLEQAAAAALETRRIDEQVTALVSAATARERADHAAARLRSLTDQAQQARAEAQAAQQHVLDLRERRLSAMAGELAESLHEGEQCPVCGGLEHPSPARRADRVTEADIELAAAAAAPLLATAQRLGEDAAAAGAELKAFRAALGDETRDAVRLRAEAASAHALSERAQLAAADAVQAQALLTELDDEERALGVARDEALATQADATARAAALDEQLAHDASALRRAVRRHTARCPCARTELTEAAIGSRHEAVRAAVTATTTAAGRADQAEKRFADQTARARSACRAEGFASPDEAAAAGMPREQADALRASLAETQRHVDAAEVVLSDPEVIEALAAPPVDLDAAGDAARSARTAYAEAAREHAFAEAAAHDVAGLADELVDAWATWAATVIEEHQVSRLAETVTGLGPDNALRMRLSAFVLAGRLERVVELANERLAGLGSGRYRLAHSDLLAPGGRRSGLGLAVDDLWTGQRRDTATLSGGESFMASLALALGLADAVREDGGGLDVQTLFVDEGFGTLDEECLEEVMGLLDQLREGGRSVGVISHVADLRTRIPAQVRVTKSATGSTVEQGGSAA